MGLVSRLTSKYQATIPKRARQTLGLKKGDLVSFEIENGAVTLHKLDPLDLPYLQALENSMSEWNSEHDEKAYRRL